MRRSRRTGVNAHQTLAALGGVEQVRKSFGDMAESLGLDALQTISMSAGAFFNRSGLEVTGIQEPPGRYTLLSHHAKGGGWAASCWCTTSIWGGTLP